MSELTLQECYEEMQANCGIKVGDQVRVLRTAKDFELGWGTFWMQSMKDAVGKIFDVLEVEYNDGILLHTQDGDFYVPFYVLEKIKQVKKVTMQEIEDKFGCKINIVEEN